MIHDFHHVLSRDRIDGVRMQRLPTAVDPFPRRSALHPHSRAQLTRVRLKPPQIQGLSD